MTESDVWSRPSLQGPLQSIQNWRVSHSPEKHLELLPVSCRVKGLAQEPGAGLRVAFPPSLDFLSLPLSPLPSPKSDTRIYEMHLDKIYVF